MKKIRVDYQCTHISCRNPKCYKGTLVLDKEKFDLLNQAEGGGKTFRSPSSYCTIGATQIFKIIEKNEEDLSNEELQKKQLKDKRDSLYEEIEALQKTIGSLIEDTEKKNKKLITKKMAYQKTLQQIASFE